MANLWSGRFNSDPDRAVFEFGASFRFDRRLFEDDVTGSIAWAEALAAAGVVAPAERDALVAALRDIRDRGLRDPVFVSGPDEDVHSFVERQLVERLGETGKRLHTGRSRNEQVSLDLRLYLKRHIPLLQTAVRDLVGALADQAERAGPALMPAYTHLRRAQPILVAHFFLAHATALQRDHRRFGLALVEADEMPLGSGAVAGTNYPIDTSALAARLGFARVVSNSVDATSDRDFVSSFLHASALTLVHLSRFAEDLILFSAEEFGFVDLADAVATGSSLMPQKKNPDPLELVRGKTGRVIGRLAGWLTTMKGLPVGYNKDLQEDKEALFDAEDTVIGCVQSMTAVVATLTLNVEAAGRASAGLLLATDVADYLVSKGMSFRSAHVTVGRMVRQLVAEGRDFASLTSDEWRAHSELFEDDVARITASSSVAAKRTSQSTGPEAVAGALRDIRQWLASAS